MNTILIHHMKTHTGEKPCKCSQYNKAVSTNTNLRNHTKTHSVEKPYQCSHCDKAFSDISKFQKDI